MTNVGPGALRPAPQLLTVFAFRSRALRLTPQGAARSTRPGLARVGGLVWICRASPADGTGRFSPGPTRDGSAASHLGGRVRFMQAGPPPFSRAAYGATRKDGWQPPR